MSDGTAGARQTNEVVRDPWAFQRWAFEQVTGNPVRKAVLAMLSTMADGNGRGEVKQATLAEGIEVTDRAVRGHLKGLEDAGLIARRPQFRRDRGRRGDEFLLLAPWVSEWPDGELVEVNRNEVPGGSEGADIPGGAEATFRGPRNDGSGQELPLGNGHLGTGVRSTGSAREPWPGVPNEMRVDADELLRRKAKVGGQLVSAQELEIAAAALSEFNRQADSDFGLGAHLTPIVGRIRERPSADAGHHVRLVQSAWRLRWWEKRDGRRRAQPQVIYGNARVFEQVWQDAVAEAKGQRVEGPARSSMFAGRTFRGRSWGELTAREQEHVKEAALMGLEVWDGGKDSWQDRERIEAEQLVAARSNGHGAVTAENFCDED